MFSVEVPVFLSHTVTFYLSFVFEILNVSRPSFPSGPKSLVEVF